MNLYFSMRWSECWAELLPSDLLQVLFFWFKYQGVMSTGELKQMKVKAQIM